MFSQLFGILDHRYNSLHFLGLPAVVSAPGRLHQSCLVHSSCPLPNTTLPLLSGWLPEVPALLQISLSI